MTAPAHCGGERCLCRGFGVITHDSAGEGLREVVKGTVEHEASSSGAGREGRPADSMQSVYSLKWPCALSVQYLSI